VRRLQDVVEKCNGRRILVLLDWEKAFDKIDQEKMFEALDRLNILAEIVAMKGAMHNEPYFRVQQTDQASDWKRQHTGIRQGCPLSPFLFTLTMHVMFHDIENRLHGNRAVSRCAFGSLNFHELLYADDTLLIAKSTSTAKKILH
jgi:hypothetical protein